MSNDTMPKNESPNSSRSLRELIEQNRVETEVKTESSTGK